MRCRARALIGLLCLYTRCRDLIGQGVAARGCYDLTQHQEASGKSMEYFDERSKTKYVPHVIEPSLGVDRLFLAIMVSAYHEDEVTRSKMGLPYHLIFLFLCLGFILVFTVFFFLFLFFFVFYPSECLFYFY